MEIEIRIPTALRMERCERCGTPLALVTYQTVDCWNEASADGALGSVRANGVPEWNEYTLWTAPDTGVTFPRMFRPHTAERCRKARNPGSEPCESCGTPIARRVPQPPDADQYEGLPKHAGVWDEDWEDPRPNVHTRKWHSPKRCREARG